jgi:hypothetical protein
MVRALPYCTRRSPLSSEGEEGDASPQLSSPTAARISTSMLNNSEGLEDGTRKGDPGGPGCGDAGGSG